MSEEHQAYTVRFNVLSERWYDFGLFSCNFIVGSESLEGLVLSLGPFEKSDEAIEGQLVNS